jgi:hypothetical protein
MTALLFAAMRDTVYEFLQDPQYLGATPGILAALHSLSTVPCVFRVSNPL